MTKKSINSCLNFEEYDENKLYPTKYENEAKIDDKKFYMFFKRMYDILISFLAIVLFFIPMIIIGVVVKATSKGPVIYKSVRVGKFGKEFKMYKFRSMCFDADEKLSELKEMNEVPGGVIFKIKEDPRTTPFGKFLRKTSLDELPQLLNVIKGDMSLIGPRAGLPTEVAQYSNRELRRLLVPQGISGEWQTHGRSNTTFHEMISLDLKYVDKKRSFFYDVKLSILTVFVVLKKDGAK